MSTQALVLTQSALNSVAKTKDILELPAVADNWVRTYQKTSGKDDGLMRFEAEKILFMQAVGGNSALDRCDKFSLYAALIELSISGLTLRDGMTYIIPYGKKAQFQVGWRGRLEQINELPDVVFCHEPVVVYDCDLFDYERGTRTRINTHKPGYHRARTKASVPTHVYFVIEFTHGPEVYLMEAIDVLNIRDNYSEPYIAYIADCAAAGKEIGDTFTIQKTGYNGPYNKTIEPPMWITDEAQAFKKTIVKRVWGTLPKLPKHKWLDSKMTEAAKEMGRVNLDADEDAKAAYKMPDNAETDFNAFIPPAVDDEPITSSEDVTHEEVKETSPDVQNPQGDNPPVVISETKPSKDASAGLKPSEQFNEPEKTDLASKLGLNISDDEY